jgi:hypothetical protein
MTLIDEMRARHEQEIKDLQEACQHLNISDWMPHYWAAAHSSHYEVKVCRECGKVIETTKTEAQAVF